MNVDGKKTQGSREIARELERLQPEPPLFPADAEKRAAVEEAERWGDEEFQHPVRQIVLWSIVKQQERDPQLPGGRQARNAGRPGGTDRSA